MNAELCAVQEKAIKQFGLGAQVVCDDVCKQKALLGSSGVIVLHNAFQFFLQPQAASSAWKTLVEAISPGTVLITCPSLEEQLACCKPAVMKDVSEWVEEVPPP
ncbi:hypothetical protein T484DRAFT_1785757 [Baffinella frigidus]|nr:hypothetical protein T484DRAFT_1785757 [Cryptophyta sp. CCMP2293]